MSADPILGRTARDDITGYEGTVTTVVHYLHGTARVCLESVHDGELKSEYFDIGRVVFVNS